MIKINAVNGSASIILAAFLIVLFETKKFFTVNYAAEKKFLKLSLLEFIFTLLVLIFSVVLVYYFMLPGFWLGLIIPNLLIIIYCFIDFRSNDRLILKKIDFRKTIKMLPVGIGLVLSYEIYNLFIIPAKVFLAATLGVEQVGYFILSILVISKVSMIPLTISQVLTPHISSLHKPSENSKKVFSLFAKAQVINTLLTGIIILSGFFLIDPVINAILPEYAEGIPSAKIMLLACLPFTLILNANNVLIATHRKRVYTKILLIILILQGVLFLALSLIGITLINTTIGYCVLFTIYAAIANIAVYKFLSPDSLKNKHLLKNLNTSNAAEM